MPLRRKDSNLPAVKAGYHKEKQHISSVKLVFLGALLSCAKGIPSGVARTLEYSLNKNHTL